MHSQSAQYINSNSNPGGEFSLDEIQNHEENELKDCDIQEYDSLETRSRAFTSTCKNICDCETPLDTVNSWDSHSHYRQLIRFSSNSLYSGITIYCNHAHLTTSIGIIRLLLIISTAACITCLCSSGIVKAGLVVLPLMNRIKFMIFVHLLGFFVTGILLFLDITHLIHLFPFNWIKLNTYFFVCLSILFLIASTLIFHTMFTFEAFYRISSWTKHHLLAASIIGYICTVESVFIIVFHCCSRNPYGPVREVCDEHQQKTTSVRQLHQQSNNSKTSKVYHSVFEKSSTSILKLNQIDDGTSAKETNIKDKH